MTFQWPIMLYSLALIPVVVLLYLRAQRRRSLLSEQFRTVFQDNTARRRNPGFRRHIPALLFLIGLAVLLVALARPQAEVSLPRVEGTIILVMDVSGSMAATDAQPNRLEAAKTAARQFILSQPETVKIGIVSFSGSGFAVQRPTNDQQALLSALGRLSPQTGTSLGQGIAVALNTIAMDMGAEPVPTPDTSGMDPQQLMRADASLLAQIPKGPFPSAVIVLLSDGENNQPIDPLAAAQAAAERSVRVHALGFGTTAGTTLKVDGYNVHTALDEAALQEIARVGGGVYYNAQNEQEPQIIYKNITPQLVVKPEMVEITFLLTGASILALLLGTAFSIIWFNRFP